MNQLPRPLSVRDRFGKFDRLARLDGDVTVLLGILYSSEGIQALTEMATESFDLQWGELDTDEAHLIRRLLHMASQVVVAFTAVPETVDMMPAIAVRAMQNICQKLGPFEPLLAQIESGSLSGLAAKLAAGELAFASGRGVVMPFAELSLRYDDAA